MKKKIFLIILIFQLVIWGLFVMNDELFTANVAINCGIVNLIISVVAYLIIKNKYTKKLEISRLKYNIISLLFWNLLNIIIAIPLNFLVAKGILARCYGGGWACFLNGIEYLIFPAFVLIASIVIILIEIIHWIYRKLKEKE